MEQPKKFLFVCTGNTCRSPMAAAIMIHKLKKLGIKDISVQSCGTIGAEGQKATPETSIALKKLGITPLEHSSQALSQQLVDWADQIFGMTNNHLQTVRSYKNGDKKVSLLMENTQVPDPVGKSQQEYDKVAQLIEKAINIQIWGEEKEPQ